MNAETIIYRSAKETDALNLVMLKTQVWLHTYATEGVRTEFSNYLAQAFTKENMQSTIRGERTDVVVAECDEHLVACAEIDYQTQCPDNLVDAPELTVLYVSEHFTGKAVGFNLLKECEDIMREKGFHGYWLTVYHLNERAIHFYNRQGFKKIGTTYFEMEKGKYENLILYKGL